MLALQKQHQKRDEVSQLQCWYILGDTRGQWAFPLVLGLILELSHAAPWNALKLKTTSVHHYHIEPIRFSYHICFVWKFVMSLLPVCLSIWFPSFWYHWLLFLFVSKSKWFSALSLSISCDTWIILVFSRTKKKWRKRKTWWLSSSVYRTPTFQMLRYVHHF